MPTSIIEGGAKFQLGDSENKHVISPIPHPCYPSSLNSVHGPLGCDLRLRTSGLRLCLCSGTLTLRLKGLNLEYSHQMKCFSNNVSANFSGF